MKRMELAPQQKNLRNQMTLKVSGSENDYSKSKII